MNIKPSLALFKGNDWKDEIKRLSSKQLLSIAEIQSSKDDKDATSDHIPLCNPEIYNAFESLNIASEKSYQIERFQNISTETLIKVKNITEFIQTNWKESILRLATKRQTIQEQLEAISMRLSFFEMNDIIHALKDAQPSVVYLDHFKEIYSKIERGWNFFQEHVYYKDGQMYLKLYEHALSRCIELIKMCIIDEIELSCQGSFLDQEKLNFPYGYTFIKNSVEMTIIPFVSMLKRHFKTFDQAHSALMDCESYYCKTRSESVIGCIKQDLQNKLQPGNSHINSFQDIARYITDMMQDTISEEEQVYLKIFGIDLDILSLKEHLFLPASKLWFDCMQHYVTREIDPISLLQVTNILINNQLELQ